MNEKFKNIKYLATSSDIYGCGYMRVKQPAEFLKQHMNNVEYTLGFPPNDPRLEEVDVIGLQRANDIFFQKWLPYIKSKGKKIVSDIDDLIWGIPAGNLAHNHYNRKELDKLDFVFKQSDEITTSTIPLAEYLKKRFNKEPIIIPNMYHTPEDFIKPKNEKIRIGWHGSYCYDEKTELLTENGWKLFKNLDKNEKVASLNPVTNMLEYHLPTEYVDEQYLGDMYYGNGSHTNFLVTPNHNMYASIMKSEKNLDFNFHSMESLEGLDFYVKNMCNYEGKEVKYFVLPKLKNHDEHLIYMDDWLKFFGLWLSDACCVSEYDNQIVLSHYKNNQYLYIIEQIAKKYKWNYTKNNSQLIIFNEQLCNYLNQIGKEENKFVPRELLNTSSRQLKILFDWIIKEDVSIGKDKRISYSTSSLNLMNDINEIAIKIGVSCINLNINKKTNKKYDAYLIKFDYKKKEKIVLKEEVSKVHYEGRIYCVTVPYHTLLVRREGKMFWCGNTHKSDFSHYLGNAIRKLKEKYDFDFYTFGYCPPSYKSFAIHTEWSSIDDFMKTLISLNLDIGIIVAANNDFNKCKSNLKYIEYSLAKVVSVADNVYPYATTIDHEKDGFLIKNPKTDWYIYLEELILNEQKRLEIIDVANKKVKQQFTFEENGDLILRKYEELFERLGF